MNPLLKIIPAYCLRIFLSFVLFSFFFPLFIYLFIYLCYSVFVSIFHPRIFLQPFFCTSFVSSVFFFFFFSFVSYVGCPYFQTYFIIPSFISSSLVVFLHTAFSFLIIYSPLSSFMWTYFWYPNRPRHTNTCPPLLHMLWRSFTYLVLVLATKPLHALLSSIVDVRIRIMSTGGREVLQHVPAYGDGGGTQVSNGSLSFNRRESLYIFKLFCIFFLFQVSIVYMLAM